jgi:muramoyltetrapeptide carboxypeptidase
VAEPIGIFAPSSAFDPDRFSAGLDVLRGLGFEPVVPDAVYARHGYLAGTDATRLASLNQLLARDDVPTLMGARGGYGVHRLLSQVDYARLAQRTVVGFSDLTALHLALWARTGAAFVHGPVVTQLVDLPDADRVALANRIRDPDRVETLHGAADPAPPDLAGPVDGVLMGGCLALVAALVGTPFARFPEQTILLLEEVAEAPYRVDRMLTQLELAGVPDRVVGVALGALTRCDALRIDEPDGRDAALERLRGWGVPVITDLPIGHGARNHAVPLGRAARLDPRAGTLEVGRR